MPSGMCRIGHCQDLTQRLGHSQPAAHVPERLRAEVTADYNAMMYSASREESLQRRNAFLRKWRVKCWCIANSLEEAGDRLFTFTALPPMQWRSARTTNALERLHEEFKRRIKHRPYCRPPRRPQCCSGPCSLQVRLRCENSMAGKPWPSAPSISRLILPPDPLPSCDRRPRHRIPTQFATAPL